MGGAGTYIDALHDEHVRESRDAEVKEEGFLEYVNQLLMTGEVAGLFPRDELDAIINDLRPAFKRDCPGAASGWPSSCSSPVNAWP